MRRVLSFALAGGLAAALASALWAPRTRADDPFFSGGAIQAYRGALTTESKFGLPRYTTTMRDLVVPCTGGRNAGAVIINTTTSTMQACISGSAWADVGVASPIAGDFVATGKWTFGSAADAAGSVRLGETASSIVFEGSGADANELTLTAANPGADVTITIPATTGSIALDSTANVFTARNTFGTAADALNAVDFNETAGQITWEGAAADTAEHRLAVTVNAGFDTLTTLPATGASQTIAVLENAQSFTGQKTFSGSAILAAGGITINSGGAANSELTTGTRLDIGTGGVASISARTENTPDTGQLLVNTSNAWSVRLLGHNATDMNNGPCGTSACTNPHLIVQDKDANATDYHAVSVAGLAGSFRVTLTESSATAVVQIPVAASVGTGGMLNYCVFASDATDQQERCSFVRFAVSNKAGTETCGLSNDAGAADASITETEDGNAVSISSGTLTYTIACDTAPTNAANITINAVSSLTQTTLQARGTINLVGPGEPLPQ